MGISLGLASASLRRRASLALALAGGAAALAATGVARGATHEYCNWDGSYNSTPALTLCFQSGDNYLTNNHAYLPYVPVSPTIYCGAHSGGSQYGGYSGGNPSCDHAYSGGNLLKADEYVSVAATTHGVITY